MRHNVVFCSLQRRKDLSGIMLLSVRCRGEGSMMHNVVCRFVTEGEGSMRHHVVVGSLQRRNDLYGIMVLYVCYRGGRIYVA